MTTTLKYTLAQIRTREMDRVGTTGHPNAWWPLEWSEDSSDCLGFQLFCMGLRTRNQITPTHLTSIAAFKGWIGWDQPPVADLRPGDLAFWNWNGGKSADHVDFIYSINHAAGTVTTIGAATGPEPGITKPLGVFRKTRPINAPGAVVVGGMRVLYKSGTATITASARAAARIRGTWLNQQPELRTAGVPQTSVGDIQTAHGIQAGDGITDPAPLYWRAIQTWGRLHGLYGPGYDVDDIPGPRSEYIETVVDAKAKAAVKKK